MDQQRWSWDGMELSLADWPTCQASGQISDEPTFVFLTVDDNENGSQVAKDSVASKLYSRLYTIS